MASSATKAVSSTGSCMAQTAAGELKLPKTQRDQGNTGNSLGNMEFTKILDAAIVVLLDIMFINVDKHCILVSLY